MPAVEEEERGHAEERQDEQSGDDAQRQADADHQAVHDGEDEPLAPPVGGERLADVGRLAGS